VKQKKCPVDYHCYSGM